MPGLHLADQCRRRRLPHPARRCRRRQPPAADRDRRCIGDQQGDDAAHARDAGRGKVSSSAIRRASAMCSGDEALVLGIASRAAITSASWRGRRWCGSPRCRATRVLLSRAQRHRIGVRRPRVRQLPDPGQLPRSRQPSSAGRRRRQPGAARLAARRRDRRRPRTAGAGQFKKRYPRITRRASRPRSRLARQRGYAMLLDVVVEQMGGIARADLRSGRRQADGGDQPRRAHRAHHDRLSRNWCRR